MLRREYPGPHSISFLIYHTFKVLKVMPAYNKLVRMQSHESLVIL
jgi:hypothetical protein